MDFDDVFSSDSERQQHSNSEGHRTVTTDSNSGVAKTKGIRKRYEPIVEGGKVYKYEDDQAEYKRMRKKIQNRESATRVRGRKKNAFENLEQEIDYYKKENSQLQLMNAKLETENKSLKDQIEFMKTLIKPANKPVPVEEFLDSEVLSHPSRSSPPTSMEAEQDVPLFEEFDWARDESHSNSNYGWLGLAVFTMVLLVFVMPNEEAGGSINAWQSDKDTVVIPVSGWALRALGLAISWGKLVLKYGLIVGYVWLLYCKISKFFRGSKMKKV